ncbi:MAG: tetratricopeptide repeat protein [Geminicoccaceae bacterium]
MWVCIKWSRRLALGAGLLLGSGALASCDDQTAVEQRLENARALIQQGDTRLAIAELKHALQEIPDAAGLRLMLGRLYLSEGDLPYAEKELGRARALGLESPELMLALGDLWLRQQREVQLLDELTLPTGWPEAAQAAALGLRARAYLRLDDPEGARRAYQAILDLDPDSVDVRIGLVRLAMRAGDPEASELLLADALRAAPDHPTLLGLSGDLAFQLTRYLDAVGMYRKQLEAAPDNVGARLALAEALIAAGELREAEALLDRFLSQRPGNGLAHYLRAAAAFQAGHVEVAQVHSERAVAAIPTHVPSMFLAGAANYTLGRLEAAHWNLAKVLAREPEHAPAQLLLAATNRQLEPARSDAAGSDTGERLFRVDLGVVQSGDLVEADLGEDAAKAGRLARAGDHAEAAQLLDVVARAAPGEPSVLELDGGLALLAGRPQAAARALEAALEKRPAAVLARKLALAKWRAGDRAASRAILEAWLAHAPDDLETRLTLADLHLAADQTAAARDHLIKVVTIRPTDPIALNNLAWTLLQEGRARAARPYAERALGLAPHEPRVLDTLALVLMDLGELDPALELLRRAAWAEAADPGIEAHLAQALARRGDKEAARAILIRLLADPGALTERDQAAAEALLRDLGG